MLSTPNLRPTWLGLGFGFGVIGSGFGLGPHHNEALDQEGDPISNLLISLDLVGAGGASQSAVISALDEQLGRLR
eukprot:scaffold79892_cov36-Phaeocystis_antarctica.AAC.1